MPDHPPEIVARNVPPVELTARLNRMRELYQHGVLSAEKFKAFLEIYQFVDDEGQIWAPGGKTSQWYRWDGRSWVPDRPPETLMLADVKLTRPHSRSAGAGADRRSPPRADAPKRPTAHCAKCGASLIAGKKFCTACGSEVTR